MSVMSVNSYQTASLPKQKKIDCLKNTLNTDTEYDNVMERPGSTVKEQSHYSKASFC